MKVQFTKQEVFFSAYTLDRLLEMLKDHIESIEASYIPYRFWNRTVVIAHDNEYGYTARVSFETSN